MFLRTLAPPTAGAAFTRPLAGAAGAGGARAPPRGGEVARGARDDVPRRTRRKVPREERRGHPPPLPPGGRRGDGARAREGKRRPPDRRDCPHRGSRGEERVPPPE